MHLIRTQAKPVTELVEMAATNGIENANRIRKQELIFALLKNHGQEEAKASTAMACWKCCRTDSDSCDRRTPPIWPARTTFTVSPSQIRRFNLHTGDTIEGEIRTPKDGERYSR